GRYRPLLHDDEESAAASGEDGGQEVRPRDPEARDLQGSQDQVAEKNRGQGPSLGASGGALTPFFRQAGTGCGPRRDFRYAANSARHWIPLASARAHHSFSSASRRSLLVCAPSHSAFSSA